MPVLAEDFPSLNMSPRNACLDGVRSCDVYVGILGARAGFVTPSGRTVVEEEYDKARECGMPLVIFISEGEFETRQRAFVDRVSDYVTGRFRLTFASADELEQQVEDALGELDVGTNENRAAAESAIEAAMETELLESQNHSTLRFALAPLRTEEVVGLQRLDDDEFVERLIETGRGTGVRLLGMRPGYKIEAEAEAVKILPADAHWHEYGPILAVRLDDRGRIVVEANVVQLVDRGERHFVPSVIAEEDVERQLLAVFRFADAVYTELDPFERQQKFLYNAGLFHVQYTKLERNPAPRKLMTIPMYQRDQVVAYDTPRDIPRFRLKDPSDVVQDVLARVRRALNLQGQ